MTEPVTCPHCQAINSAGSPYCHTCGNRLPGADMVVCPNCDSPNSQDLMYCDQCGTPLPRPEPDKAATPADAPAADELAEPAVSSPNVVDEKAFVTDWLSELETITFDLAPEASDGADEAPAAAESDSAGAASEAADQDLDDSWLQDPDEKAVDQGDDEVPAWMHDTGPEEPVFRADEIFNWTDDLAEEAAEAKTSDWLAEAAGEADASAWLSEPDVTPGSSDQGDEAAEPGEIDLSGFTSFLDDLDTVAAAPSREPAAAMAEDEPAFGPADEAVDEAVDEVADELADDEIGAGETPLAEAGETDWSAGAAWLQDVGLDAVGFTPADPDEAPDEGPGLAPAQPEKKGSGPLYAWPGTGHLPPIDDDSLEDAEDEQEPVDLGGFTDWLTALQDESGPAPQAPADAAAGPTEITAVPEMAGAEPTGPPPDDELAAPDVADGELAAPDMTDGDEEVEEDYLPDWLQELAPGGTGILSPPETAPDAPDEGAAGRLAQLDAELELPEWLADMAEGDEAGSLPTDPDAGAERTGLLDNELLEALLAEDDAGEEELPLPEPDFAGLIPEEAVDVAASGGDEFDDLEIAPAPIRPDVVPEPAPADLGLPDAALPPPISLPDDLFADLAEAAEAEEPEEALAPADLPEWLRASLTEGAPAAEGFAADGGEFVLEEMPDWMQAGVDDDFDQALEAAIAVQGEALMPAVGDEWADILGDLPDVAADPAPELEPAEIPDWLEALRPGESGVTVVGEEPAETAGPLLGVRGVIDIEPIIALPRQLAPAPALRPSREQQQQALLLRQLTVTEPKRVARVGDTHPGPMSIWLQLAVALVLILALLVALLPGLDLPGILDAEPPPVAPAARAAYEAVQGLAGQTVLVAYEYTPAMAGELGPQAQWLLGQLQAQGTRVVTISQFAAGAALAEQDGAAISGLDVTALGYLPGDIVGLRQLGACLPRLAGCRLPSAAPTSAVPGEISLIFVLAGERDGLVAWIEQAATPAGVPVVLGVTQALAPLAQPYVRSGQVAGLIAGMPDLAAVEAQLQGETDGPAGALLTAQTIGQWLAIVLLVAGNLLYWLVDARREPGRRPVAASASASRNGQKESA